MGLYVEIDDIYVLDMGQSRPLIASLLHYNHSMSLSRIRTHNHTESPPITTTQEGRYLGTKIMTRCKFLNVIKLM